MTRVELAAAQARLVRALVASGALPPGFDERRLRATAHALIKKRSREVAMAWPLLVAHLGDRFGPLFAEYAATHPPPRDGGPLADGHAFGDGLGEVPPQVRRERLQIDLLWRRTPFGLERRKYPSARAAWSHGLIVGAQVCGRVYWIQLG